MAFTIAIQPDDYTDPRTHRPDASSPIWASVIRRAGHRVRWVNVFAHDIIDQLTGCDALMWRHGHTPRHHAVARRLMPAVEHALGLPVYPDHPTAWHYDDKIAQKYLLEAAGIPIPKTWLFWDADLARAFCRDASYPLVLKLSGGAGSTNVIRLDGPARAEPWIARLFGPGVARLDRPPALSVRDLPRRLRNATLHLLRGELPTPYPADVHNRYILLQEFVPDNPFDTRVTVVGHRAFAFRRWNREGDFRASGSGCIDHDPDQIATEAVCLAFRIARTLGTQSVAIDFLRRGGQFVVGEISYAYASWAVHQCPGHWTWTGRDADRPRWHAGRMFPEEAQAQDLLNRLRAQRERRVAA